MVPEGIRDFFVASAGVGGTLIGLLFVAISISADRLSREKAGAEIHRIRAVAALTAFTNALVVSLFALIPGETIGGTALVVAILGLLFVTAALLRLIRLRQLHWSAVRDGVFLVGLTVTFIIQLTQGLDVIHHPHDAGAVTEIAILVVVCFTVGVSRSWELIGAPSIGIRREVLALVRNDRSPDEPGDEQQRGELWLTPTPTPMPMPMPMRSARGSSGCTRSRRGGRCSRCRSSPP